ncbi:hypothetical protein [Arcobacter sp. F2176]|uniref:hypothetical protein n=1 Tax=Arcobacter sp. F2176 TaxID=2044511 RepID=UPI00100C0BBC|nr:hypothetical protein [Arcobacter sp. F2176]RXJ81031.1 hypothetical protein CRU95_08925 [Arcobacter sp. F2176]
MKKNSLSEYEFKKETQELKIKENISLTKAKDIIAKKYGYSSYYKIKPFLKKMTNYDLVEGLQLPSNVPQLKAPKIGNKELTSLIAICFGHIPQANKNRIVYEYEINLNATQFGNIKEDTKIKLYNILSTIMDVNTLLQESFFSELSILDGVVKMKSLFLINFPFGKKRELLEDVYDQDLITLIFSIKHTNKEAIKKNNELNADKSLDKNIEKLCLLTSINEDNTKQILLIELNINIREGKVLSRQYDKFGVVPKLLYLNDSFNKEKIADELLDDVIFELKEYSKINNINMEKDLAKIKDNLNFKIDKSMIITNILKDIVG